MSERPRTGRAAAVASGEAPPPRANPLLIGHAQAEELLLAAYASGRLPHAWLISGPRGIGKATLAFRFARFLLSRGAGGAAEEGGEAGLFGDTPVAASPSGMGLDPQHPVFRRIASGGHADLLTVERRVNDKTGRLRSEIVIDDVRGIASRLAGYTAAEGGWRVAIVDAAEEMNRSAANAILKVLEEPPAQTVLLLISHNPGRLLATIRSRCRRLPLRALCEADLSALLARYRPGLAAAERAALVHIADGSIGRALTLADQGGAEIYTGLLALMAGLPRLDLVALDRFGERLARPGAEEAYAVVTELVRRWLARLIRCAAVGEAGAGDAEEWAVVTRIASAQSLDRWLEVWEKTCGLLARAESANLDRKQVVLNLFLNLQGVGGP